MNEVNIHKQIQGHPNIVSLHKVFDDHGVQFLYMVLEHMANGHVHPPPPSLELPSTPHVERCFVETLCCIFFCISIKQCCLCHVSQEL